ncbi:MAG: hypothetical protein IJ597_00300 [Synergistaceae bacterium]|nr:hypothetical protein [Synergistaceae bacterium]
MSDLASNVTWQEILRETEADNIPHCRAIAAPGKFHNEIIETLANLILKSYRPEHPYLIIIGSVDKPAPIGNSETMSNDEYRNSTRGLLEEIILKPLEAKRRLGVIMSADKLNKSAANSLLKLAEEPPAHAYLLFLMEDERFFLPTLRSRSHFSVIHFEDEKESYPLPKNDSQWLEWLKKTNKADLEIILKDLKAWENFAVFSKNFVLAEKINKIRVMAEKENLSVAFLCDIIILTLKGENQNLENIFSDIW